MTDYYKNVWFIGSADMGQDLTASPTDATTEAAPDITTETTTEELLTDDTLYLSEQYVGKTIDDVYSMLVSTRNSILLLCIIVFLFEAHKVLKNAFRRHYKP